MSGCGADPPFVRGEWTEFKSGRLGCKLNTPSRTMPTSNMSNRRDQERIFIEHQRRTKQRFAGSKLRQRPYLFVLMASAALILLALLVSAVQSTIPMCQYHRAFLEQQQQQQQQQPPQHQNQLQALQPQVYPPSSAHNQPQQPGQDLIVCPKSSQYNNLPQFPPTRVSPTLERQQREILKTLNASFTNHLQLSFPGELAAESEPETSSSELIDDQLLNEIVSPVMLDAAYERAKELIVKRRKLESELVRQGKVA